MTKRVLVPSRMGPRRSRPRASSTRLRRAGAEVTVASVETQAVASLQITASRGMKLVADARIADCVNQTYDCIALPGGMPGAEHLRDSAALIEKLKQQKQSGRLYGAICASPAVALQPHGLLEKTRATCYPGMRGKLDPAYASDDAVVVDGHCVTSQGPGTAIAFALKLVELLFGARQSPRSRRCHARQDINIGSVRQVRHGLRSHRRQLTRESPFEPGSLSQPRVGAHIGPVGRVSAPESHPSVMAVFTRRPAAQQLVFCGPVQSSHGRCGGHQRG